jgi:hypothetical protein
MRNVKIKKGTRVTGDARALLLADLKHRYVDQNKPIRTIVQETGRSYGTVHLMLSEAGVLRSKGGNPRPENSR